jgi:hypothetical protein
MSEQPPPTGVADRTPTIHRVLIPGDSFYVCGFMAVSNLLPDQPMIWLGREPIVILPFNCLVERWTRGELFRKDWTIIYSPPAGCDLDWLADHPDFDTAA